MVCKLKQFFLITKIIYNFDSSKLSSIKTKQSKKEKKKTKKKLKIKTKNKNKRIKTVSFKKSKLCGVCLAKKRLIALRTKTYKSSFPENQQDINLQSLFIISRFYQIFHIRLHHFTISYRVGEILDLLFSPTTLTHPIRHQDWESCLISLRFARLNIFLI